jgi:hypothetical protein
MKNDNTEITTAHTILVGKYESNGPLEKHKHRQKGEMSMCGYLREI